MIVSLTTSAINIFYYADFGFELAALIHLCGCSYKISVNSLFKNELSLLKISNKTHSRSFTELTLLVNQSSYALQPELESVISKRNS